MSLKRNDVIKRIQALGLSEQEAGAYLVVTASGPCTALQVARSTGLQRTEIYTLMSGLVRKGLVQETLDRPKRYRPSDPETALASLAQRTIKQLESVATTANELVPVLKSLESATTLETEPEVRVLNGWNNMRAHFFEVVKSAQREVWMMCGRGPLLRMRRAEIATFLKTVSSKRLKVRLIAELDREVAHILRRQIPLVEIRHCQELHSTLYGVDDRVVALGLTSSDAKGATPPSQVVISHPHSVKVMRSFFEAFWDNTIPFDAWLAGEETQRTASVGRAVIWGRERLYAAVADWHLKAKKWILNYMPSENGPARVCAYLKDNIIRARNRGAKTRSLCRITGTNLAAVKELSRFTEVRHVDASPGVGFGILDESEAVIQYLQSDTRSKICPSEISVHITERDSVCRLVELFNLLWDHSIPAEVKIRELSTIKDQASV